MKRLLLLTLLLVALTSCSSRKQVEKALYNGNYDSAIQKALKKLDGNLSSKRNQDLIVMLHDAYHKVTERDLDNIAQLQLDGNPEYYSDIYELYINLDNRQQAIKPLLPLKVKGKPVAFTFNTYTQHIIDSRANASNYLYGKAKNLLLNTNKWDAREAYTALQYIESINPNYKDVRSLMQDAHVLGTDFVLVNIQNHTNQIIPRHLETDLLNFNTYGLSNFWVEYHAQANPQIAYTYAMDLVLQQINISPEHIYERELLREQEIVDGWEYQLDANGNVAKDSLGNDIKIDKIVTVSARLLETQQHKAVQILGVVKFTDLQSQQLLDSFPIDSGFVFEHWFARFRGDKRALTREDLDLLNNRLLPFPSNEQMVFDAGEELKQRLKDIISQQRF